MDVAIQLKLCSFVGYKTAVCPIIISKNKIVFGIHTHISHDQAFHREWLEISSRRVNFYGTNCSHYVSERQKGA